jgi:hypothetical protein
MLLLRLLKTLEFKIYANNSLFYKLYRYCLNKYEKEFDKNNHKALKKMVNLYVKVNNTCFHDLVDSIGLWMDHYGDNIILEYIQNKRNNELKILEETIKNKLQINNNIIK